MYQPMNVSGFLPIALGMAGPLHRILNLLARAFPEKTIISIDSIIMRRWSWFGERERKEFVSNDRMRLLAGWPSLQSWFFIAPWHDMVLKG